MSNELTDLHEYLVGPRNAPTEAYIFRGEQIPTVIGHEFSGTITELSSDARGLKAGQKCAVFPILGKRDDPLYEQEMYGMCPTWGFLGYSGFGGGMAEYICVDARDVFPVPDSMSLEVAALVEPLAVGWHAVALGFPDGASEDSSALVLGAGPIGISVILCLCAQGVRKIIVSEISALRSQQAKDAGASHVLNPLTNSVVDECKRLTDSLGCHVALECAGVQASFDASFQCVRGRGTVVNVGIFEKEVTFDPNILNRGSLRYIGSNIYTRAEFQAVIGAIADGRLENPERMITARVPLGEGVEKGFAALLNERNKHVKILLKAS